MTEELMKKLPTLDLAEKTALVEIKSAVESEIDLYGLRPEAFELYRVLKGRLRYMSSDSLGGFAMDYVKILTTLEFVAYAELSDSDALQLVRDHLVDVFSTQQTLEDVFQRRLVEMNWTERDEFKTKVRDVMSRNNQILTAKTLVVGGERTDKPSISNWIRDYTYNLGSAIVDREKIADYFSRNKNILLLGDDDRQRVKTILGLYERFKYPSNVFEGMDGVVVFEHRGGRYLAMNGEVIPLVSNERSLNLKEFTRSIANSGKLMTKARTVKMTEPDQAYWDAYDEKIYKEEEKILNDTGVNPDVFRQSLKTAILFHDQQSAVAFLAVSARSGMLSQIREDQEINELFSQEFLRPLAERDGIAYSVVHDRLVHTAKDLMYDCAFIFWALNRVLDKDEAASARIGNQIENTLAALGQTEVVGMTYFDVSTGSFHWTPLKVHPDGSLAWAG